MEEIIWWLKIALGLFTGFVVALIYGMAREQLKATYFSLLLLLCSLCAGAYTVWLFVSKSYHKVQEMKQPRTGDVIYSDLFGPPENACTQLVKSRDKRPPRIDAVILLYFQTCPAEFRRIVAQEHYVITLEPNAPLINNFVDASWPRLPGDSVRVFSYESADGFKNQYIYASLDSTQVLFLGF